MAPLPFSAVSRRPPCEPATHQRGGQADFAAKEHSRNENTGQFLVKRCQRIFRLDNDMEEPPISSRVESLAALRMFVRRLLQLTGSKKKKPRHAAPGLLLGLGKCPLASAGTSSKTLLQSGSDTCDPAATPLKKRSRPSRCKDGSHNTATSSRSANTAYNGSTEIGGIALCAISVAT